MTVTGGSHGFAASRLTASLAILALVVVGFTGLGCTADSGAGQSTPPPATNQGNTASTDPSATVRSTAPTTTAPPSSGATSSEPTTTESPTVQEPPDAVRGLRVSRPVAANPESFEALLELAENSTVNALVFDTKDETGQVLYETRVAKATELGAVAVVYDPSELLAEARERGLYPITRIVTFEDPIWSQDPGAVLAGTWVNAVERSNWDYPLDLAEEACRLGFAEIQFDYIRFPAGRTAQSVAGRLPDTSAQRSDIIAEFLTTAAERLDALGCGVSAAVFGITVSSPTDEGIGQELEIVAPPLDAISPMVYPSHYGAGWLGFDDPNEQPGPVVADALDDAEGRLNALAQRPSLRPWLQAFSYDGSQVRAQVDEAEARGAGWLLWNSSGRYQAEWLPTSSD